MPTEDLPAAPVVAYAAESVTVGDWSVVNDEGVSAGVLVTFEFAAAAAQIDMPVAMTREGAAGLRDALADVLST